MQQLDATDVPGLLALSEAVAWDYDPAEFKTALAAGTLVGCKGPDGVLQACAGLFPYGRRLCSLGMVIVHPSCQGQGLGRLVTRVCMDRAAGRPTILAATDLGRPLYERLGFQVVDSLHKLIATRFVDVGAGVPPGWRIANGSPPDFAALVALDAEALGEARPAWLRARMAQVVDHVWLIDSNGRLGGFALGIQTPAVRVIGPVVAPDAGTAQALVAALGRRHPGPLRIDIPSVRHELVAAVGRLGFALNRVVPVMGLNLGDWPGRGPTSHAIAAQAYG